MSDIRAWLKEQGLEQYGDAFAENDITFDLARDLTDGDLKDLGVASMGHRKTLLRAIGALSMPSVEAVAGEPAAERRPITVMFCDLVGSTALSEQLDPEDLRAVMQAYQQAAGVVIERYGGHVAQYLGDGLMTYFGWPQAHEDDAERAARAGLEIINAVKTVRSPRPLAVRVGIATGPVVVGETGAGDASVPKLAVGETPNLAARVQSLAEPDQVVIAPATRRLIGAAFTLDDMGDHALKGIVEPVRAWRVRGVSTAESRFDATRGEHLTPLVGREAEVALVLEKWRRAMDGEGQVLLLSGEAGIGKSRMTRALMEAVGAAPHTTLRYQCSPHHQHSALHPFIAQLERAAGFQSDDAADAKWAKLEALLMLGADDLGETLSPVAALLSLPISPDIATQELEPQRQKQLTLQALIGQLYGLSKRRPVLMIFEDAHWADPTSQELLDRAVSEIENASVLILITHRPEYQAQWSHHSHVTLLGLSRLSRAKGLEMARAVGGTDLTDEAMKGIVDRTDGIPLFVEELTRSMVETGTLSAQTDIPSTLQASLLARLDRLGSAKEAAQIGAVIGREFPFGLLASVSGRTATELIAELDILVGSGLVFQRGSPPETTYSFKHALVQDTAYESLLRGRRKELHARVANVILDTDARTRESEPELIAHHLTKAGEHHEALRYWRNAGELARERSAHTEAVAHVGRALELLESESDPARRHQLELSLRRDLASSMMLTKGFASVAVGEAHARYFELCETYGAQDQIAFALHGLCHYHFVRAEPAEVHTYGRRFLALAQEADDDYFLAQAHFAIGGAYLMEGRFPDARRYQERALEIHARGQHDRYIREWGYDVSIFCRGYLGHTLWHLGYPDQARATSREGVTLAKAMDHPFSVAVALAYDVMLHQFCRMPEPVLEGVGQLEQVCAEYGFAYYQAWAGIMRGWAESTIGTNSEALDHMHAALRALRATDARTRCGLYSHLIAERQLADNDIAAADETLRQVGVLQDGSDERWVAAERLRMRGLLESARGGDAATADDHLKAAQATANRQSARSLELRAATDRARLLRAQGRHRDARDLLAPIHGWFTEGFDTKDLKDAEALL
jgi:class 3 adenylate cyclase/tetratricopeptide (TPR) repeat protein